MEDFSFSLNEAKPKCFGLETFAVVLLASWNLPCLLPAPSLWASSPQTAFPMKDPRDSVSKSCNASGNLDLPVLFVIFLLKIFLLEKKSPSVFRKVLDESCAPVDREQIFCFICWGEVCVVLCLVSRCSCGQGCQDVCMTWSFSTPFAGCGVIQQQILSLCYDTLKI